jgi:Flp pilus assembly protein TadB
MFIIFPLAALPGLLLLPVLFPLLVFLLLLVAIAAPFQIAGDYLEKARERKDREEEKRLGIKAYMAHKRKQAWREAARCRMIDRRLMGRREAALERAWNKFVIGFFVIPICAAVVVVAVATGLHLIKMI